MFVKNTKPRAHAIGLGRGQVLTLLPGVNEVDEADWEKAQQVALVRFHVKQGVLEVLKGKAASVEATSAADTTSPKSLDAFNVSEAKALIEDTVDTALLKRWKSKDDRVGVGQAIDAQLEKLKLADDEDEEEDEDQQ